MKKQYIDKDILMSQLNIELSNLRKAESEGYINEFGKGKLEGLEGIADFILNYCDSEVDLEEEFDNYIENQKAFTINGNGEIKYYGDSLNHVYDIYPIAKYFFGLGLKMKLE